jgi:transposase
VEEKNISVSPLMLKPEVSTHVKIHKPLQTNYLLDHLLQIHGHTALQLLLYHPDMNPIEIIWSLVKGHVIFKMDTLEELCVKTFAEIYQEDWKQCWIVKELERGY